MQVLSPFILDTIRVTLIFIHVVAMAVAIGLMCWLDIALVTSRRVNAMQFQLSSARIAHVLVVLWLSGLTLIGLDSQFDLDVLAVMPKIQAKLLVVTLLSLNGWALHRFAFPTLMDNRARFPTTTKTMILTAMGAISTVSWIYAIFLGIARPLTPTLGFGGFIGLYAALLIIGVTMALRYVRPRVERLLRRSVDFSAEQICLKPFDADPSAYRGVEQKERSEEIH